jgi:hypothetical protein
VIINIRGTNGSGKTTIVKKFLKFPHSELYGVLGVKRPEAYKVDLGKGAKRPLFVIGSYQSATGGMDALPLSATEQVGLLIKYQKLGHVLFEGVVISTYYGAVGDWLAAHRQEALVIFLNTSLEVCLDSIKTRTGEASRTKNVEAKIKSIESARKRMIESGIPTLTLNRDEAFARIKAYIE